jgi:hypothetical protein
MTRLLHSNSSKRKSDIMQDDPGAAARAAYRAYVQRFELSVLDVAMAARVRLPTVWRVAQGLPIGDTNAQAVRAALLRLTGVPYRGQIAVLPEISQA